MHIRLTQFARDFETGKARANHHHAWTGHLGPREMTMRSSVILRIGR
jgi:hypothetical protein